MDYQRLLPNGCPNVKEMVWSFSRLNSWHNCKACWEKSYILKEEGEQNAFAEYGVFCHELLEKYAKDELMIWDLVDEYTNKFKQNIIHSFPPNKYVDLEYSYYEDGLNFFKNFQGFEYEVVNAEEQITMELEDEVNGDKYKMTGYIDLILKDVDGNIIVMDHKSKSKFKNKNEQAEYAKQLYIYSKFIKEKYGKFPKKLIFNMFRKESFVEIDFNENDYNESIQWAIDTINDIKVTDKFDYNFDMFFCNNMCNHRLNCEEKKKQIKINYSKKRK